MFSLNEITVPEFEHPGLFHPVRGDAHDLSPQIACRIISGMTGEMLSLADYCGLMRRYKRRTVCHIRQISIYICHVALRLSYRDIAIAYRLDRSTVCHACNVVENRRDAPDFNAFITALERLVQTVFNTSGGNLDV